MDEDQGQPCKEELGADYENQRFESPGSDPQSSEGNHCAMVAEWVDEKSSYPGRQSRIAEVDGDEVCSRMHPSRQSRIAEVYGDEVCLEMPASHRSIIRPEMYDPSGLPTELPISGSLRRRSSPELRHPINSESDRHSLWHRRRGMPAADRHCSDAKQALSDQPNVHESGNAISSSPWAPSKPVNSLHSVPIYGDEAPAGTASSEEPKDPHSFWTRFRPMSDNTSSHTVVPTAG